MANLYWTRLHNSRGVIRYNWQQFNFAMCHKQNKEGNVSSLNLLISCSSTPTEVKKTTPGAVPVTGGSISGVRFCHGL